MARNELKNLQARLLERLSGSLVKLGFSPDVKQQKFVDASGTPMKIVHISFVEHKSDFAVVVDVALRWDDIEQLITELGGPPAAATIGAELGNLSRERKQRRYVVAGLGDIESVASSIRDAVQTEAISLFNELRNVKDLFKSVTAEDRRAILLSPVSDRRWAVQLAAAILMDDREAFEETLAKIRTSKVKSQIPDSTWLGNFVERVRERQHWI